MKKGDLLRVGEVVRINAGKWRGAAGLVVKLSDDGMRALVDVSGIFNGNAVVFAEWFKLGALGRNE